VSPGAILRHQATFEDGLAEISAARGAGATLVAFLGSNLGNFDGDAARGFLREMRAGLAAGDRLLIGLDLVKAERDMLLAYDDPLGVTAAFNLNLLVRLNRDLGADVDLRAFRHRAVWNARQSRIEMHLVSARAQRIRVAGAGLDLALDAGEPIWTESSYKYTVEGIERLLDDCGFRIRAQWVDAISPFALTLAEC
jgi:L-histidine N-alpha-methyltransferase